MARRTLLLCSLLALLPFHVQVQGQGSGQVTSERLLNAAKEPHNWLSYGGTYSGQRYSALKRIDPSNVKNLEMKWVFQSQAPHNFQATPLVVDGMMYLTQPPNDIIALDAKTGRVFWTYLYANSPDARVCCGFVNRGLAILGDTLFMATVDAHLIAVDARSGGPLWNAKVADATLGYSMTVAPLVIKDKVLVGVGGGEFGVRGFVAAYDARTGKEAWRFYTVAGPDDPGFVTWKDARDPDAWKHGGAPIWVTGTYDPELNLTYWGTGNPGPDFAATQRSGDNLYSDSVVALDADTGKLKWHFQFTPHDLNDYDSTQVPVLADLNWNGAPLKAMLWGNRNGFFYVLDRATGKFLQGTPYVKVNWASGLDEKGRPMITPQPPETPTFPCVFGGTNWYSPSFSPRTGLFYVSAWENCSNTFTNLESAEYVPGRNFGGGGFRSPIQGTNAPSSTQRPHINTWTEELGTGAVMAIDPSTGAPKWKWQSHDVNTSGILTTASDLLFVGGREGYFHALDARTGAPLWKATVGWHATAAPITYEIDAKQYVGINAGHCLFVFGLRD